MKTVGSKINVSQVCNNNTQGSRLSGRPKKKNIGWKCVQKDY